MVISWFRALGDHLELWFRLLVLQYFHKSKVFFSALVVQKVLLKNLKTFKGLE